MQSFSSSFSSSSSSSSPSISISNLNNNSNNNNNNNNSQESNLNGVIIIGIETKLIIEAIQLLLPSKNIVYNLKDTSFNSKDYKEYKENKEQQKDSYFPLVENISSNDILVYDTNINLLNEIKKLKSIITEKEKEIAQLELSAKLTSDAIVKFHSNQNELYNEFAILSQKYDEQKASHVTTLWTHCAQYHPEISMIPNEEQSNFPETQTQIGRYKIGEPLGDGQFATVYNCSTKLIPDDLALKIIQKNKITSFPALRRVSNEIKILKKLKNQYVIRLIDVIHTKTKLYLVTEKGGRDLFEFFESHPTGVGEVWALEIASKIAQAVHYCHINSVCHRDLKPENILLTFDEVNGKCFDLKLCDFGLAVRCTPSDLLCDFCGSPGFFAPEMMLAANYRGDKADIWSMGCIFLELLIGNELFWNHWMVSYDVEVLQDKNQFRTEIITSTDELPNILNFSSSLNSFLISILQVNPDIRPTTTDIFQLEWIRDTIGVLPPELSHPTVSFNHDDSQNKIMSSPSVSKNMLKTAMNNREKQRNSVEFGSNPNSVPNMMMMTGMEQQTPTITKAKKIIQRGDDLRRKSLDSGADDAYSQWNGSDNKTPTKPQI